MTNSRSDVNEDRGNGMLRAEIKCIHSSSLALISHAQRVTVSWSDRRSFSIGADLYRLSDLFFHVTSTRRDVEI